MNVQSILTNSTGLKHLFALFQLSNLIKDNLKLASLTLYELYLLTLIYLFFGATNINNTFTLTEITQYTFNYWSTKEIIYRLRNKKYLNRLSAGTYQLTPKAINLLIQFDELYKENIDFIKMLYSEKFR